MYVCMYTGNVVEACCQKKFESGSPSYSWGFGELRFGLQDLVSGGEEEV